MDDVRLSGMPRFRRSGSLKHYGVKYRFMLTGRPGEGLGPAGQGAFLEDCHQPRLKRDHPQPRVRPCPCEGVHPCYFVSAKAMKARCTSWTLVWPVGTRKTANTSSTRNISGRRYG
ncbi:hypothetical protein MTO96_024950 [Rhipicephalus appendiculatus]